MDGVHIYSLGSLAGYGTSNLLENKYLNKLILRYIDSIFPSIESLLLKLLDLAAAHAETTMRQI